MATNYNSFFSLISKTRMERLSRNWHRSTLNFPCLFLAIIQDNTTEIITFKFIQINYPHNVHVSRPDSWITLSSFLECLHSQANIVSNTLDVAPGSSNRQISSVTRGRSELFALLLHTFGFKLLPPRVNRLSL